MVDCLSDAFVSGAAFITVYLMCWGSLWCNIRTMSVAVKFAICQHDASWQTRVMMLFHGNGFAGSQTVMNEMFSISAEWQSSVYCSLWLHIISQRGPWVLDVLDGFKAALEECVNLKIALCSHTFWWTITFFIFVTRPEMAQRAQGLRKCTLVSSLATYRKNCVFLHGDMATTG